MNITEKLAIRVEQVRFEDLTGIAILEAKKCFIDGIGITVLGSTTEPSRILKGFLSDAGGNRQATTLGVEPIRTSMRDAALFNGLACHVLDYDDTQAVLGGHPTAVILPVVLSVGEYLRANGKMCLTSLVAGIETSCKVARMVNPNHYRSAFHVTATIGVFGAAAAAGLLLGLSAREMASALGIAGSMSCGLKENFGTMTKSLHAGWAASSGIVCALLAKRGFGSTRRILEGEMGFASMAGGGVALCEEVVDGFGRPWEIEDPGITRKRYACCARTHGAIQAILRLSRSHSFGVQEVRCIECETDDTALRILAHPFPTTGLEAKFSMPFCIAMALIEGRVLPEHFSEKYMEDPVVAGMMRKVKHSANEEITKRGYPHRGDTRIKIILEDGRELNESVERSREGSRSEALTQEEVNSKFVDCVGGIMGDTAARNVLEKLGSLELEGTISEIIHSCAGPSIQAKV